MNGRVLHRTAGRGNEIETEAEPRVHERVTRRNDHTGMAVSVDQRVVTRALPSPSSTLRLPRRAESDSRLGSAARCLTEMLRDPSSLSPGWRAIDFQRAVRHIREEL